jgi:hypothetical protein
MDMNMVENDENNERLLTIHDLNLSIHMDTVTNVTI